MPLGTPASVVVGSSGPTQRIAVGPQRLSSTRRLSPSLVPWREMKIKMPIWMTARGTMRS
eukprot:13923153-Alexandrium_andersonii.AAC.1